MSECSLMDKVLEEDAWRKLHAHGAVKKVRYPYWQPPSYKLEMLKCFFCDARFIKRAGKK